MSTPPDYLRILSFAYADSLSATICCAALIMLEGLSAEAALARVRQHHPWCRPDTHHWLALRWLAQAVRS